MKVLSFNLRLLVVHQPTENIMFWGSGQRFCRSRHRDQYAAAVDDLLSRAAGVAGVQEAVGEALLKSDDRSVQLGVGIAGAFIHAGNPFF